MRSFIIKSGLFTVVIALLTGLEIHFVNVRIDGGGYYKINPDKNMIIVGHSHTECDYNDSLIDRTINLSSGGEGYFYTYFKLKKVLSENPQINTVFIGYSNNMIETEMDEWIWGDEYVAARYPKYSAFMQWSDISLLLRKNPRALLAAQPIATKKYIGFLMSGETNILRDQAWGGYLYLERDKTDSLIRAQKSVDPTRLLNQFSEYNLIYLDKMIEECNSKGVRVFLLRSPLHPEYRGTYNEKEFLAVTNERYKGTEFLDFRKFPLENNLFGDLDHLNHKGAKVYSEFFNQTLQKGLLDSFNKQNIIDREINLRLNIE